MWACEQTWALLPEKATTYAALLERWIRAEPTAPDTLASVHADMEARSARAVGNGQASSGGIAVLPMYGVIAQRINVADELSGPGSLSCQRFSAALREALDDDAVDQILIDIDSPGGSVFGVAELADEIYAARSIKPIVAICNSLAASAAYWLGSQATELHCTPGGECGSIGVIAAHLDYSKQNEMLGVKVSYIYSGKYKSELNPDEPLSKDARDYEASRVAEYYSMFTRDVARGRRTTVDVVRSEPMGPRSHTWRSRSARCQDDRRHCDV
jgi:signal peptide peptidase SppA